MPATFQSKQSQSNRRRIFSARSNLPSRRHKSSTKSSFRVAPNPPQSVRRSRASDRSSDSSSRLRRREGGTIRSNSYVAVRFELTDRHFERFADQTETASQGTCG